MNRRRLYNRHRLSRDAERLAWLAQGLSESGSRMEDVWWETEMVGLIDKLLTAGDEDALNQALDRLHETTPRAYDELADMIEASCEGHIALDRSRLLIALPILAWSRYAIPARAIPTDILEALRAQLSAHVLGAEAKVHFADHLFSPDQLPQGYVETREFADALDQATALGQDLHIDANKLPEGQPFISDVRYLLAAIEVPTGRPLFRWNEADGNRQTALGAWREQGGPNLHHLLAGCAYEMLLPEAYFAAWRLADRESRPFALKAAVDYLQTLFAVPAGRLRAVVAPYYERSLVEWRVGFTLVQSDEVVHGVTWPILGSEDEGADLGPEIEALLKQTGIGEVRLLDTRMPLEYCDDCGAPLFPNPEAENVHAELPEDMSGTPAQLH